MQTYVFSDVLEYLHTLTIAEQSIANRLIDALRANESAGVRTKQLKGPVRELIVGNHRITYFVIEDRMCFVRAFRKKTKKTPPAEIKYAEKAYKAIKSKLEI